MRIPVQLWLNHGSFRWTGAVWQSGPVHLDEPVWTYIIQCFIYRGVYYFTEPNEGTVWFSYGLEVHQFFSYDRPLNDMNLENCEVVEILGIAIDINSNFKSQLKTILKCFVKDTITYWHWQKTLLYKPMIRSHFTYCPLVWTFWFRQSNNMINKVHGRVLKLIYQDNSSFERLLEKQQEFSYHQSTWQVLMINL